MHIISKNTYYINSAACDCIPVNISITTSSLSNAVVNLYDNVPFTCTVLLTTPTVIIIINCSVCHLLCPDKERDPADIFLPFVKLKGSIGLAGTANKKRGATDKKGE